MLKMYSDDSTLHFAPVLFVFFSVFLAIQMRDVFLQGMDRETFYLFTS